MPVAHQPQGARRHQGHVEEVLHPDRRQQQQRPAGEHKEDVKHQEGGRQEDSMADQGLVGFGALAARPAAHPGLDGPSAQPTEPGEQSEHQRHGHQPRQRDRLAEEK